MSVPIQIAGDARRLRPPLPPPPLPPPPQPTPPRRITLRDLGPEPFRLFFPMALLAGIVGVALWPLHVWGLRAAYPGLEHARLMAYGLFGGFILGFLGTVLPRQTSTGTLSSRQVLTLGGLHLAMVASYALGARTAGDVLAIVLLSTFAVLMIRRLRRRRADPPAAFVLVALALACAIGGALLSLLAQVGVLQGPWLLLQRLLAYQGFVLLPILGVGTFILPGLFGTEASTHFTPDMLVAGAYARAIRRALIFGTVILASFPLEAWGATRVGHALRLAAVLSFLWCELPLHRGPRRPGTMGSLVRLSFACVLIGYGAILLWPAQRIGLLHLSLVGGFALLTFVVAARVAYGHGGRGADLRGPLRWLWASAGIMLFAMATRLSGDLWPQVRDTHYAYAALVWLAAAALWAVWVLPLMRRAG